MASMSRIPRFTALALSALALAAAGCRPTSRDASEPDALSNRPQSYDRFIAILKLKTPPLLSSAHREGGHVVVDDALRAAITSEQAATEAELAALSSDIKVLYRYRLVL